MKIEKPDNLEIEGNIEGIKAGIAQDSLPFLFDLVTKNFYSDPIGSVCREITSNCFDAHKEAGIDEPVIIKKEYDLENDCWFIHFIDKGVGLSRERLVNIYMNYFTSTKRDTNDLIGGFGLGSKSPLAYQDLFYITTVHNGKKYELILSRGKSMPELDSFYGLEVVEEENEQGEKIAITYPVGMDTDEPNGTCIKIQIKEGDHNKFQIALKQQLCYFDDVYFDGWSVDNNYNIFEGETFKYRNKDTYSNIMHIVYGKVCYPIDWRQLKRSEIEIAVGVKFQIGELIVTPNRESIIYTDEIKELVNKRIDNCIKELVHRFNEQNPKIEDFFEYLNKRGQRPNIQFDEVTKLYIPKKFGVENAIVYQPLADIKIPDKPFFEYDFKIIDGERLNIANAEIPNSINNYFNETGITSKYTNAFIRIGKVITPKKISFEEYCEQLELYFYGIKKRSHYSYSQGKDLKTYDTYYDKDNKIRKYYPILGKALLIKKYKDELRKIILSKSTNYHEVPITEEWIKQYKKDTRETSAAYLRKLNQKVVVRIFHYKEEVTLESLSKYRLLIYDIGNSEVKRSLKLVLEKKWGINCVQEQFCFIEVAKTNEKIIRDLPNSIFIDDFLKDKKYHKVFRDIKLAREICYTLKLVPNIENISKYYKSKIDQLTNFKNKYYIVNLNSKIENLINSCDLINYEMESSLKEVKDFLENLEILDWISLNAPRHILKEIFRYKKKLRLDQDMYSLKEPMKLIVPEPQVIEVINEPNDELCLI